MKGIAITLKGRGTIIPATPIFAGPSDGLTVAEMQGA